jgi:hypothetical protein
MPDLKHVSSGLRRRLVAKGGAQGKCSSLALDPRSRGNDGSIAAGLMRPGMCCHGLRR